MKLTHEDLQALSTVTNIAHHLSGNHEKRVEIIEAVHKVDEVITKLWLDLESEEQEDDVIRVGDKVIHYHKKYYVTHIDDENFCFPYKLSFYKCDIGLDSIDLASKYGYDCDCWQVSTSGDIKKVKSV